MRFSFKLILTLTSTIALISGCSPSKLNYRLDPEVRNIQSLSEYAQLIAVSVSDNRPLATPNSSNDNILFASGPQNEAALLKTKLIDSLKKNGFKIISNPLLADLSIDIEIEKLEAKVTKSLLRSTVEVVSHLRLKANKQSKKSEKIYKMNRSQEVANPASELDVTGVVNQLLSKQLSVIFSDPMLKKLASSQTE
ncbi:YajG family lipoprotein [Aliikangiella sp. IMCC44359]|uniref:YajG family lipoprotein n=1 Tax=Aliikangiella sp. IMCC44359 TaxID=3459125 RepID=UPI00403AD7BD